MNEACDTGQFEMCRILYEAGAEINVPDDAWRSTPLCHCMYQENYEQARWLLEQGARLDWRSIRAAAKASTIEGLELLIEYGLILDEYDHEGGSLLFEVNPMDPFSKTQEVWIFLLDAGVDVNALNHIGDTVLLEAVIFGGIEIMTLLLEHGADPTIRNADGETALELTFDEEREKQTLLKEAMTQWKAQHPEEADDSIIEN